MLSNTKVSKFVGVVMLCFAGVALANPLSWFESTVVPDRLTECPAWAEDADSCATAGPVMGDQKFLAVLNEPPAGYEYGAAWDEWAELPHRCEGRSRAPWPSDCRIAMELLGPTQPVIVVQANYILLYLDDAELRAEVADSRAGVAEEAAASELAREENIAARRASRLSNLSTGAKIQAFARELFRRMNVGERTCPASQAEFRFAACGQTHGDAEIFRKTTDLFLKSSEWFDGEIATEWLGSSTVPYKGVRIDGVLVTITFEGSLGPFGNFGRAYVNANY